MASRLGGGATQGVSLSLRSTSVNDGPRCRKGNARRRLSVSATIIPRFFFEPPKPYPYKLGRRPEEQPPRPKQPARLPSMPKTPNPTTSKVLVDMVEGGLPKVVERAKHLAGQARF